MRKSRLLTFLLLLFTISVYGTSIHVTRISYAQASHDIAVTSISLSVTDARLGDLVSINVVVENQGTVAENFTVTAYYDTTTIDTKNVTDLPPLLDTTLVFTWNTTCLKETIYATAIKEKSYAIKANATAHPDETDTQDNQLVSPNPVRVVMHYIAVVPQRMINTSITPNMNYTVSIYTDYNGSDIWSWQFSLEYDPVILEGLEVRNGDLITTAKHANATFIAGNFDNTKGELSLTVGYFAYTAPPAPMTSGPGTLAYVTFRVKDTGKSNITLNEDETELVGDPDTPDFPQIINDFLPNLGHVLYGSFGNTEMQIIRDIAVTGITVHPLSVTKGELVNITVIVENQGTRPENFDVRLYSEYNPPFTTEIIGTPKPVLLLAANANETIPFTWNTTNVKPKDYNLTAVVPKIPEETDITDNIGYSETVTVKARELQPLPVTEIIIGVVAVIAVITVIVILRRRRKKPSPE